MSASFILLRQRTVELLTLAASEPRGSAFLNRYATGSLMNISYQMPMPMGAPSSELTGCAAEIFLVQAQVQHVAFAEQIHQRRLRCRA